MRVGIFTSGGEPRHYVEADLLVRSVRTWMPGVQIAHFTDERTPALPGADRVCRRPHEPLAMLRTAHQAAVEGEWLFVDTDVVLQADVRSVFNEPFDVAVADRNWPQLQGPRRDSAEFVQGMHHNIGVVFSRSQEFWKEVHERVRALPPVSVPGSNGNAQTNWMGDQIVACDVIREGRYNVRVLPGVEYNYPPSPEGEDGEMYRAAKIVHYKGPSRKPMLFDRFRREAGLA